MDMVDMVDLVDMVDMEDILDLALELLVELGKDLPVKLMCLEKVVDVVIVETDLVYK